MLGHYSRHVGPRFDRGNWSGPRFFRGYRRPAFFYARPGYHRLSGRWQQPSAEQQALRSTYVASTTSNSSLITSSNMIAHSVPSQFAQVLLIRQRWGRLLLC